jgi:hypothetical protein
MDTEKTTQDTKSTWTQWRAAVIVIVILVASYFVYGMFISSPASRNSMTNVEKEQVIYSVTMNSGGNDVVAYDVILAYDPAKTSVGIATSSMKDFKIVQKEAKPGVMAITAFKLPSATDKTIFEDAAVLSIPVTQAKGADNSIYVVQEMDSNTTKLINADSQKIYLSDEMIRIAPSK